VSGACRDWGSGWGLIGRVPRLPIDSPQAERRCSRHLQVRRERCSCSADCTKARSSGRTGDLGGLSPDALRHVRQLCASWTVLSCPSGNGGCSAAAPVIRRLRGWDDSDEKRDVFWARGPAGLKRKGAFLYTRMAGTGRWRPQAPGRQRPRFDWPAPPRRFSRLSNFLWSRAHRA